MHFSAFPPFAPIRAILKSITQQAHHMPRQVRQTHTRTISPPPPVGGEGGGKDLQLQNEELGSVREGPGWLYQSSYHYRLLKADTMSPCTVHSVL
jgi:hypothetical protein